MDFITPITPKFEREWLLKHQSLENSDFRYVFKVAFFLELFFMEERIAAEWDRLEPNGFLLRVVIC